MLPPEQARPPRWPYLFAAAVLCNLTHIPIRVLLHFIGQYQIFQDQFGIILLAAHAVAVPFFFGALVMLIVGKWDAGRVGCFVTVFACSLSFLTAPAPTQTFAFLNLPLWPFLIYGGQNTARKWWTWAS